jgi:Family of unknown function (DUF6510)
MTNDTHLDGNALGGILLEVFGREMTDAHGCCAHCGSVDAVGAMLVYRGAGTVMRCPGCEGVEVVATTIRQRTRIHLAGVRWLEPA